MQERFQFMKSYAEVIDKVAEADEGLAEKLCMKIVRYGIYGVDEDSGNPMLEALFVQIKMMIDKGQEITEKNKENGMKGGRPKNPNKTQTKPKQNPNESEQEAKKTKIENRKEKIENRKEENNEKKITKKRFLDFVDLSEDEHNKLLEKFGEKKTREKIEKLNNYIGSTGKKYKSHYFTILNWSREDPGGKDYEREKKIELHNQKIIKQFLDSESGGNESNGNQTGGYNRRNDIGFSEVSG